MTANRGWTLVALLVAMTALPVALGGCPRESTSGEGPVVPPTNTEQVEAPPVEVTPIEPVAASAFTLPLAGGGEVSLSDYEGKILVLDFWATWCTGCVKELPAYQELVESWDSDRVAYLGISLDDSLGQIEAFLKTRRDLSKLTMALADEGTAQAYLGGRRTLPSARVIDARGMIRYSFSTGEQPAKVKAAVEALLSEPMSEAPPTDAVEPGE